MGQVIEDARARHLAVVGPDDLTSPHGDDRVGELQQLFKLRGGEYHKESVVGGVAQELVDRRPTCHVNAAGGFIDASRRSRGICASCARGVADARTASLPERLSSIPSVSRRVAARLSATL